MGGTVTIARWETFEKTYLRGRHRVTSHRSQCVGARCFSSSNQLSTHLGLRRDRRAAGRTGGQKPRPLYEKATRRSCPHAAHRNRAKPLARHPHRRKSRNSCSTKHGSPVAVPQRRGMCTKGLEMVPHDAVQNARCRIVRLVSARWPRHAPSTGLRRANARNLASAGRDPESLTPSPGRCACPSCSPLSRGQPPNTRRCESARRSLDLDSRRGRHGRNG